jgi:FixJ family two-component response regulator
METPIDKRVIVLDPDDRTRTPAVRRLQGAGFTVRSCASTESLAFELRGWIPRHPFCLVSELHVGRVTGLEVQRQMRMSQHVVSVVFFAAHATARDTMLAMRSGAIAVVEKSQGLEPLVPYVAEGVETSRCEFFRQNHWGKLAAQLKQLKEGEREVLSGVIAGKTNKQMAEELRRSERAIENRRSNLYRKMDVNHAAALACKVMLANQLHQESGGRDRSLHWLTETVNEAVGTGPTTRRLDGPHV